LEKPLEILRDLGFAGLDGKKVLDLGCGQRYPSALICAAHGATVTALDIVYSTRSITIGFLPYDTP